MPNSPFQERELEYDPFDVAETRKTTSADRAITQDQFRDMLTAADELDPILDVEAKFILFGLGRLGMRIGELTHMKRGWIDFENEWVSIPEHESCDQGRDGGLCGGCTSLAKQMAEQNDMDLENAKGLYWKAKTIRAARDIPYSYHDECANVIESYFEEYDHVMASRSKISRKCDKLAEKAGVDENVTPHGLRATAAMYHVETGLDMWGLQSLMGWAYPNTARRYILNNSRRTKNLLERRHETSGR